jgi:hypothetical protein
VVAHVNEVEIEKLAEEMEFQSVAIYQVDGTKWNAHSNAYAPPLSVSVCLSLPLRLDLLVCFFHILSLHSLSGSVLIVRHQHGGGHG